MNRLSPDRQAAVVRCLVEGNSIRATVRMTGAAKNTVTKLLVELGEACMAYLGGHIRDIRARRVQCDEIWSFVGCKQDNLPDEERGQFGRGDVWTWTALDADTKLMISWAVDNRTARAAEDFINDLRSRLATKVQLTTDGQKVYLDAVDIAFGPQVDYAMLVKVYGDESQAEKRYSPAVCVASRKEPIIGNPDPKHISTSYVERQNLTMRMSMRRFTRLTNAFSKKVWNHGCAVALHFMHYNFARPHQSLKNPYPRTPAMAAGLTDHVWTVEEIVGLLNPN
jgi:IS1 family transposase